MNCDVTVYRIYIILLDSTCTDTSYTFTTTTLLNLSLFEFCCWDSDLSLESRFASPFPSAMYIVYIRIYHVHKHTIYYVHG